MSLVLIGVLGLFSFNNRLAKAQVNVADMQQSLRAAQTGMIRVARMAGRGGLPSYIAAATPETSHLLPAGASVEVANNVEGLQLGDNESTKVVDGTDVLTVRGVFNTPLYQVSPAEDGDIEGAATAGNGTITIRDKSPTGVPQDLTPFQDLEGDLLPEGLILVSAGSDSIFAVVELTGIVDNDDSVDLTFSHNAGKHVAGYAELSTGGAFPSTLNTVASVGVLEEYRYYVRDAEPAPRLARARFYPGTDDAYAGDPGNLVVDVADNILDLQVALGIDRNPVGAQDGVINDGEVDDAYAPDNDDWLFNDPGDDASTNLWNSPTTPFHYLRINTLARTGTIDLKYTSPPIASIEDRVYEEPEVPSGGSEITERQYRRRLLRTVIDLRNL